MRAPVNFAKQVVNQPNANLFDEASLQVVAKSQTLLLAHIAVNRAYSRPIAAIRAKKNEKSPPPTPGIF